MICNLKAFGLLLVAALVGAAVSASMAQAGEFTGVETVGGAKTVTTNLDGSAINVQVFKTPKVEVKCEKLSLTSGHLETGAAKEVTITPSPSSCMAGAQAATVFFNGCGYRLHEPGKLKADEYTGTVDLHCPKGSLNVEIVIYASTETNNHGGTAMCTITVLPTITTSGAVEERDYSFEAGSHFIYTDTTGVMPTDVDLNATLKGVKYKMHGLLCPEKEGSAGEFSGQMTLTGTNKAGEAIDTEVSG